MFDFLSEKFAGVLDWLKNKGILTESNINEAVKQIHDALTEADVPYDLVESFLKQVKEEVIGQKIDSKINPGHRMIKIVHDKLLDFLGGKNVVTPGAFQIPSIIMVMGLQGSGKTTTVAKIAYWIKKKAKQKGKKRKILLASIDFYRPAAVKQLQILAKSIDVDFYIPKSKSVLEAAIEINNHFKTNRYELLFLDTAGRLHLDKEMMDELLQINKNLKPKYKFLVLDSMTGQESLNVAKTFDEKIGFNSAILTKMDSDTRGGAAFAFKYALKKNISFVGVGERVEDLQPFIPERMASRILGMGDVLTLMEETIENTDRKESEGLAKKFMRGNFTLDDFASQLNMVNKVGSLQKIAKYLPNMGSVSDEQLQDGQLEMKKFKAIISSMNKKERIMPQVLDASRKRRIANGSGTNVQEINKLLQRFEQSKQFAKMFKKSKWFNFG